MMAHVWAGAEAPELYAAYTVVTGLRLDWRTVLGREPTLEEIGLVVECVNIAQERAKEQAGAR